MAIQTFERLQTMTYTKLDLIEKPVSNFILPWKFLINSPIIDVYLLEERMWRIPDSLRFRLSENERYLIIGVPHRFILMFMETILWCSCIFLCAVTISVILASSSRHEPEYLFILDLVNVGMGFSNRGCRSRLQRPIMVTNENYLLIFTTLYNSQTSNYVSQTLFRAFRRLHTHTEKWDQYQYLGNCLPTPPLTQH